MIEATITLLADAANISQEGKLNLLGEFDLLMSADPPWFIAQKMLVLKLRGTVQDQGEHVIGLRLLEEDGGLCWSSPDVTFSFPSPRSPGRPTTLLIVSPLPVIRIDEEGDYEFEILVDGYRAGEISLSAIRLPVKP